MGNRCPKCHADNLDDSRFCHKCATPLPPSEEVSVSHTKTLKTPTEDLARGTTFAGRYEIIEELGKGGMGVVYKAKDTKLKRTVALKFLSPELIRDSEAKERFIHEAQAASALDHPNICTVHEIDEAEEQMFIAMAYIDGQSLRQKIEQGPLKLDEALDIAIQVAEGLYEAHEKGIVHRDIKSSNIMVTAKGQAKIMDFGVAKLAGRTKFTRTGTTIGTVAYMSPEQARGEKVDHRADIWSLGVVLYEMVIGQLPFKGDHEQAVMYSILHEEPEPMTGLRTGVPMELERIVNKALTKDPAARYQHADEIAVDLKAFDISSSAFYKTRTPSVPTRSSDRIILSDKVKMWGKFIFISAFSALVTFLIIWNLKSPISPTSKSVQRFAINLDQDESLGGTNYGNNLAISPDGKHLIYQATANNIPKLYLRPMDQFDATPLPGTESAENPFFSPNGRWIGFFQAGWLKKERLGSASPVTICKGAPQPYGATWGADDFIIFKGTKQGLLRVSASGGTPQELTTPETENNEISHRSPQILPGGQAVLFQINYTGGQKNNRIAVLSLKTSKWKIIFDEEGYYPFYAPSGHIVFTQAGIVMAVPFNLQRLEISGLPFPVLEDVLISRDKPINLSFSNDGTTVFISSTSDERESLLTWVNHQGQITLPKEELLSCKHPRVSPDGKKIVMGKRDDFYVYEIERNILTQLTFKGGVNYPVWSSDGKLLAFTAKWKGDYDTIHLISIDGSRETDELLVSDNPIYPASWSPDGMWLAYYEINPTTQRDIWVLSLGDRTAKPVIATQYNERVPMFSPDGRFIAYVSNDTGRDEIFVQPYPTTGAKWQISEDGGTEPQWAPNGKELYYRIGNKMMSVKIESEPTFKWKKAQILFEGNFSSHLNHSTYDINPDGDQFLMVKPRGESVIREINVVLNWFEELKRLAPAEK